MKLEIEKLPNKKIGEQGYVYFLQTPSGVKIGKTHTLKSRIKTLIKEFNNDVELLHFIKFNSDLELYESAYHFYFIDKNNGYKTEYFDLNNEDIESIKLNQIKEEIESIVSTDKKKMTLNSDNRYLKDIRKLTKQKNKLQSDLKKINKSIKEEKNRMNFFISQGYLSKRGLAEYEVLTNS